MLVLLQLCVCQLLCTGDGAFSNGQNLQPQAVPVISGAFPLTFFLRSFLPHNNRSIFQLVMLILPYHQKVTDTHYEQRATTHRNRCFKVYPALCTFPMLVYSSRKMSNRLPRATSDPTTSLGILSFQSISPNSCINTDTTMHQVLHLGPIAHSRIGPP